MKSKKPNKHIALFALEKSADLFASRVIAKLKEKTDSFTLSGVGGSFLQKQGQQQLLSLNHFQVMGFTDVLKKIIPLYRQFHLITKTILQENPDALFFVDSPAFSKRVAKHVRKKGYTGKIIQFIAPTVWAYKPKRAEYMAQYFDLLLTLFDFEPPYFEHTSLKTLWVGHPVVEVIEEAKKSKNTLQITEPILALFPGSRPDEIKRNLPKQLAIARAFCIKHPQFQIAVSGSYYDLDHDIHQVPFEKRYELMQKSSLAIAKCGTVTLELALFEVPTLVTYELTALNRFMAKYLLDLEKMPYYSIVNILLDKEQFPESIKPPNDIQTSVSKLLHLFEKNEKIDPVALYSHLTKETLPSTTCSEILYETIF